MPFSGECWGWLNLALSLVLLAGLVFSHEVSQLFRAAGAGIGS